MFFNELFQYVQILLQSLYQVLPVPLMKNPESVPVDIQIITTKRGITGSRDLNTNYNFDIIEERYCMA